MVSGDLDDFWNFMLKSFSQSQKCSQNIHSLVSTRIFLSIWLSLYFSLMTVNHIQHHASKSHIFRKIVSFRDYVNGLFTFPEIGLKQNSNSSKLWYWPLQVIILLSAWCNWSQISGQEKWNIFYQTSLHWLPLQIATCFKDSGHF